MLHPSTGSEIAVHVDRQWPTPRLRAWKGPPKFPGRQKVGGPFRSAMVRPARSLTAVTLTRAFTTGNWGYRNRFARPLDRGTGAPTGER